MRTQGLVMLLGGAILGTPGAQAATPFAAPTLPNTAGRTLLASALAAAAPSATGCLSKSTNLPWGSIAFRTWTPNNSQTGVGTPQNAGVKTGAAFSARLIQAYGLDTNFSRRTAILETSDGCRRQYQTASFSAGDISYVAGQISAHPLPTDTATYATSIGEEGQVTQAQIDAGQVKTYQTQHYNLMYGTATSNVSYAYEADMGVSWPDFLAQAGRTMEYGWTLDHSLMLAQMPYATASTKKKINIYICGTGLSFIADGDNQDCAATAAAAVYASSIYLQLGSTAMWHEFGHSIQFYSGGFRDKDSAGPIWETGANWTSFTTSPTVDNSIAYYYSNLENGPLWSYSRYGAYPLMSYFFEKDSTRPYVWSTWLNNQRDANGASLEDWTQTLVRTLNSAGVYTKNYQSFADDMGWFSARLASSDFQNQKTLSDLKNSAFVAKLYTPLRTTSAPGTYSSATARPLLEWGAHIIPLTATSASVSAMLTGSTSANSAAWRWVIVSVAADGTPRYSPLGTAAGTTRGANIALAAVPGEKMYLVVTATPYAYQSLGWQQAGAVTGNTFPYSVTITGATPLTGSATTCNSVPSGQAGQDLNWNTNGNTDQPVNCS